MPRVSLLVLVAVASHSLVINLRQKPGVNKELRYNPLVAGFYNFRDAVGKNFRIPDNSQLLKIRDFLGGSRSFLENDLPIWQTALPKRKPIADPKVATWFETAVPDNPNVILIISESMRSKEIENPRGGNFLFPELKKLINEGLYFSGVLSSGNATHFGQSSILCSLLGTANFSLVHDVPLNRANCLGDFFRAQNYSTAFFYGGDNQFDNQGIFYSLHGMQKVVGSADFDRSVYEKGGWGYSDHSLFEFSLNDLSKIMPPFFSTILTLTNHAPFVLPSDAPEDIKQSPLPIREKISLYVDWAIADFVQKVRSKFPNTLIVVTADHGMFWDEQVPPGIPSAVHLKNVSGVPLLFLWDKITTTGEGARVDRLASNVDLAPTLLSILGWRDLPNQFMGEVAVEREGPVFVDWQDQMLMVTEFDDAKIVLANDLVTDAIRGLLIGNKLAPEGIPR